MRDLRSYTRVQHMPTKLPRIAVTKDAELAADEARRHELTERLIAWSMSPDGIDREALRTVRETARRC